MSNSEKSAFERLIPVIGGIIGIIVFVTGYEHLPQIIDQINVWLESSTSKSKTLAKIEGDVW